MRAKVMPLNENPLLNAALGYAGLGWHVLPCWPVVEQADGTRACGCGNAKCHSPGKHPIGTVAPWGQKNASTDAETIRGWWARYPTANIAVFLEPSGLCAIDIDPRNGGLDTIEMVEGKNGPLVSDVLQFTGGGGEHRIFLAPPKGTSLPGKLGAGVDVKLNGYCMLEPSNHISGKQYLWEASSDPRDGVIASPLPDWLRDLAGQRMAAPEAGASKGRAVLVSDAQRLDLTEALQAIPSDDRDTWLQVGMALESTGDTQWAFSTWDAWSRQSAKYDPVDQARVWHSFRARGLDGVTYRTVFDLAKQNGLVVRPMPVTQVPVEVTPDTLAAGEVVEGLRLKQAQALEIPADLLNPPGILGVVAQWINDTSAQPQPQFAVQGALAFAATVLGRRFITSQRNWPSLYFLNVGKSGSGKEHAKFAVEALLKACGLAGLIGPSGYTSHSGLLSALLAQPNHITVIDEFHRVLESASVKNNTHAQGMVRMLIETWGRAGGTLRPQGASTFGMSDRERDQAAKRTVENPSLTMLSMAVPDFWETIGSAAARDGFLNRFLIVESSIGRQLMQPVQWSDVPTAVINWAESVRGQYTNPLVDPDSNAGLEIQPVVIDFSPGALELLSQMDAERLRLQDEHEADGLAEMFGRTREIAMRLSLIVALASGHKRIEREDARWAITYASTYARQTVQRLLSCMADSQLEATKNQVMQVVLAAPPGRGCTLRELHKGSRRFRALTHRQQLEVLNSLRAIDQLVELTIAPPSGRGKPRTAWFAVEEAESAGLTPTRDGGETPLGETTQ